MTTLAKLILIRYQITILIVFNFENFIIRSLNVTSATIIIISQQINFSVLLINKIEIAISHQKNCNIRLFNVIDNVAQ